MLAFRPRRYKFDMIRRLLLPGLTALPAWLMVTCGRSDYDQAAALYARSRQTAPATSREYSEPVSQAIRLLENYLSRNHEEPRATLLLWRCYLRTGNPRAHAMHETMLRLPERMRRLLPEEIPRETDPYMRERLVALLGELATSAEVTALVKIMAEDKHPAVQAAAAEALARLQDSRAVAPLLQKLAAPEASVRDYACRALAVFPRPEIYAQLMHRLIDSTEVPEVRVSAGLSLTSIASRLPELGRRLAQEMEALLLQSHTPQRTQMLAAMVLARLGIASGYRLAMAGAQAEDISTRGMAIVALGYIGTAESVALIAPALDHENPKLRLQAAEALGNLRDRNGLPSLYKAMNDPVETVRVMAQKSIDKIRSAATPP